MAESVQRRYGTTLEHESFHGDQPWETTVDTDKKTIVLHDGLKDGGYPMMREDAANALPWLMRDLMASVPDYIKPVAGSANRRKLIINPISKAISFADADHKRFNVNQDTEIDAQAIYVGTTAWPQGKDIYIYVVWTGTSFALVSDVNAVAPTGYTTADSYCIGMVHTLCQSVSNTQMQNSTGSVVGSVAHPAAGFNYGDIIPNSIQTRKFFPAAGFGTPGMAFVDFLDTFVGIYFSSLEGNKYVSKFGNTVQVSKQYGECQDYLSNAGLELLDSDQFSAAMEGCPQEVNIQGNASPNTAGGHTATNGNRMISKFFIEDPAGVWWTWVKSSCASGNSTIRNWSGQAGAAAEYDPLSIGDTNNHHQKSQLGGKGQLYGETYALLAGGYWGHGSNCGSRCFYANILRVHVFTTIGARGASRGVRLP